MNENKVFVVRMIAGIMFGFNLFLLGAQCSNEADREAAYGKQHCAPKCVDYHVEFDYITKAWRCFCAEEPKP